MELFGVDISVWVFLFVVALYIFKEQIIKWKNKKMQESNKFIPKGFGIVDSLTGGFHQVEEIEIVHEESGLQEAVLHLDNGNTLKLTNEEIQFNFNMVNPSYENNNVMQIKARNELREKIRSQQQLIEDLRDELMDVSGSALHSTETITKKVAGVNREFSRGYSGGFGMGGYGGYGGYYGGLGSYGSYGSSYGRLGGGIGGNNDL